MNLQPSSGRETRWGGEKGARTCDRILCRHFTEEQKSDIDDKPDDKVAYKYARWTSPSQGTTCWDEKSVQSFRIDSGRLRTCSQEETGAYGSCNSNHLDLSCGQSPLKSSIRFRLEDVGHGGRRRSSRVRAQSLLSESCIEEEQRRRS
jgi:hypothetical protein